MSDSRATQISPQDALVAVMIAVSVSDEAIRTSELVTIQQQINFLPIFADYDTERLQTVSGLVFDLLEREDGLDALFALLRDSLPDHLYETAYALACDVGAADGQLLQTELRFLLELRDELEIDRLHAAAIERGSRARHATL